MRTKNNFIIACLSLIIGFLSVEALLWLIFPLPERDNIRMVAQNNISPGLKKQIIYEKNYFGFRSLHMRDMKKDPDTIRVICLGASTTDQPTQRTCDIWSAILEEELQKQFNSQKIKIEVAAMGTSGRTVIDRLFWAQNNILKFNPDLVIILEGVNDLCWHGGPGYTYKTLSDKLANMRNNSEKHVLWKALLRRFSQIYRRLTILRYRFETYESMRKGAALEWSSKNLPGLREKYRKLPYVDKPQRDPDPITEFSDGLFALIKFLRKSDIRVIVLGQPVLWKTGMDSDEINALWFYVNTPNGPVRPNILWLEEEMSRYNNIQKEIANTLRVPYIDLDRKIPKDLQYFFDDCHFTDLGNVKVATEIFPVAQEQIEDIIETRNKK